MSLFSFRGETSYPYLSGYTWAAFANWKMLNMDYGSGPSRFNPEDVKKGETIFVDYNCLKDFSERILPKIQAKVILITANYGYAADNPMPGPFGNLLENPKIIAWFVQNIDQTPSEKLIPIPIGIANKCWNHGNTKLLDEWTSVSKGTKSIFCYLNYTVLPNRVACTRHFHSLGIERTSPKPFANYLEDLSESVFVVSPPGNGVDCHRTWEALLMGCYPIVLHSKLNPLYLGLPVVIVQDWSEVTLPFLEAKHQEFKSRVWSRDLLYAPLWFQKIKNLQDQIA